MDAVTTVLIAIAILLTLQVAAVQLHAPARPTEHRRSR